MTDGGKRELALQTLDESGNIIASHTLLVDGEAESYKNIIEKFQKGKIHGFKKDGKIVKKYTMCPLILGNYFLIQKLQEEIDNKGNRKRFLFTFDSTGK